MMKDRLLVAVVPITLALAMTVLGASFLAGCGDGGDGSSNSNTLERAWVHADELANDSSLHAKPEQVVVIPLAGGAPSKTVRQTIRWLASEPFDSSLCIAADEPHITAVELRSGGTLVARAERGGDCQPISLPAGAHHLHLSHDGSDVPAEGAIAFLHRPSQPVDGRAERATNPSFSVPDFFVPRFGASFVTYQITQLFGLSFGPLTANLVPASGGPLGLASVYRTSASGTAGEYILKSGSGLSVNIIVTGTSANRSPLLVGNPGAGPGQSIVAPGWRFVAKSDGQFTLCSSSGGCVEPDPTQQQMLTIVDGVGAVLAADYRGYDCSSHPCGDSTTLPLQRGQIALFAQENFHGPAIVFDTDVSDLSIYNTVAASGLGMGEDMVRSIRVGPDTLVYLYQNRTYGGVSLGVGADLPTLAGTNLGNASVSSFHVGALGDHVLATNSCPGCVLTGADLRNIDLSHANLAGAKLANADLSGTRLRQALLDHASLAGARTKLTGADFSSASLACTDFSGLDLTATTFGPLQNRAALVADRSGSIAVINLVTGQRTTISGGTVGSGPPFAYPIAVRPAANGILYVLDDLGNLTRVDAAGNRTILTRLGTSPHFEDLAVDASGKLFVAGSKEVIAVDPISGARSLVSGASRGSGPALRHPFGIAIDRRGQLIVADHVGYSVVSVDPATGNRTTVSSSDPGASRGSGPALFGPFQVAISAQGDIFVTDGDASVFSNVFRIDPNTGNRSDAAAGGGPSLLAAYGIAMSGDDAILVGDVRSGLVRVDIATGSRSLISASIVAGIAPTLAPGAGIAPCTPTGAAGRLIATGATIDAAPDKETFPLASWRYIDLTQATIKNAQRQPLSTIQAPLDLSGAVLSGVKGLSGAVLDGVLLNCATPTANPRNCAQLIDTDLDGASLQSVTAIDAVFVGANLTNVNLEQANLRGAQFQQSPSRRRAAVLDGAYLKNANLSGSNLSGASLVNANWYSGGAGPCDGGTGWTGQCAAGSEVTASNADFNGAYLAGLDLSGSTAQGASFEGAMLPGAFFNNANLSADPATTATHFNAAFLQGANFSGARTDGAIFTGAYVDLDSQSGLDIYFQLNQSNLQFAGYLPPSSSCLSTVPDPPIECVLYSTTGPTIPPAAAAGYVCPDGGGSPCGDWRCRTCTPSNDSVPPASISDDQLPGSCTFDTLDFCW